MAKRPTPRATGEKTYILELTGGNIRQITVPANWKMTFGHLVPYSKDGRTGNYQNGNSVALRLYEGSKENLRVVMTDVRSIRDASMKVLEKRTTVSRKVAQKASTQGSKDVIIEARVTQWVDPDDEEADTQPNEFLAQQGRIEKFDLDE